VSIYLAMHQAETTFLFVMQCGEIGYHQCQLCLPMNQCCSNCGGNAESLCHMVGERVGHQCQYIWRCTKLKHFLFVMQCGEIGNHQCQLSLATYSCCNKGCQWMSMEEKLNLCVTWLARFVSHQCQDIWRCTKVKQFPHCHAMWNFRPADFIARVRAALRELDWESAARNVTFKSWRAGRATEPDRSQIGRNSEGRRVGRSHSSLQVHGHGRN